MEAACPVGTAEEDVLGLYEGVEGGRDAGDALMSLFLDTCSCCVFSLLTFVFGWGLAPGSAKLLLLASL